MILRYANSGDMDNICRIWQASFGDSEEFIREFFGRTGILATTVAAEIDGQVRAFMCAFDGIGDMSYLYALCTQPEYRGRGIGGKVLLEAIRLAHLRGASAAVLHPASSTLAKWYADSFDLSPCGYFTYEPFEASPTNLTAREAAFSELLGADTSATKQLCAAQEILASFYGGCLLRVGCSLVYAEMRENEITVKSAIRANEPREELFSAIAKFFGTKKIIIKKYHKEIPVNPAEHYVNLLGDFNIGTISSDISHFDFPYILD